MVLTHPGKMTSTFFTFLLLFFIGCGGAVHFVKDKVVVPPPPPPPIDTSVTDHFLFQKVSGTAVVVFSFYPLGTMSETVGTLTNNIDRFLKGFWAYGKDFDRVVFIAMLSGFSGTDYSLVLDSFTPKDTWEDRARTFFRDNLATLRSRLDQEGEGTLPFVTFSQEADRFSSALQDSSQPVWLQFVYFRNRDIFYKPEELKGITTYGITMKEGFSKPGSPFSSSRYRIYPFLFLDENTSCHPFGTKLGLRMRDIFASHPGRAYELCEFEKQHLSDLAGQMWDSERRMILSRTPQLDTLTFKANGNTVPREKLLFHGDSNEIEIESSALLGLNVGAPIEVKYEPKK